jgi:hypothetical protein
VSLWGDAPQTASGTIVALLPGDRELAERTAREIVRRFEDAPLLLNGTARRSR